MNLDRPSWMDFSTWSVPTLGRQRVTTTAIITAVATASVGIYFFRESRAAAQSYLDHGSGQGLHRSNAVRRQGRRSRGGQRERDRRNSTASSVTSADSHPFDENVDIGTFRTQVDGAETLAEENAEDNWWDDQSQMPMQRAGQNIVSLLFRVSEDNARRNAYVHRGCACNACGIVPIRGIRYRCANCADFDLCETCESQGLHIKTHVFYKLKVPCPPFGPRVLQSVWYPGDPDTCLRSLPRQLMGKLSKETGFERPELEAFWEQWTFMANTEWRDDPDDLGLAMDRKTFDRCLVPSGGYRHTAPNLIYDRMFSFYDSNNDDLIGFVEFLHGLSYRKRKDKLKKVFEGYDVDRDGLVNRRDFLRIFRAYYVLYKQMHKDILEGLDDQVMSSTEAHQLVSSRQPLSSLFGREGRVPPADHGRPMEGKIFNDSGDIMLGDENAGVVSEDKPDISNREQILTNLFSRDGLYSDGSYHTGSPHISAPYLDALLNPPSTLEDLPALFTGDSETLILDEVLASNHDSRQTNGEETEESSGPSGDDQLGPADDDRPTSRDAQQEEPLDGIASSSENRSEVRIDIPVSNSFRTRYSALAAQRSHQRRSVSLRKSRVAARKRLHDRWKRRQFYLDEEEGGLAPEGWDEDEDVLVQMNGMAESSKSAPNHALSPRSRSSSKVRFAEDTDDYDIRSNPSTSSRSVPERWGGMDIPDAEKDAGKEILYQVTQQAFNELLDILFKPKEDLAIRAAATKEPRDKYRHLFEAINLAEEDKSEWASSPEVLPTDSLPINEESLPQLLESSGYTVDESREQQNLEFGTGMNLVVNGDEANEADDADEAEKTETLMTNGVLSDDNSYRDPTMPQFRPNSLADVASPTLTWTIPEEDEDSSTELSDDYKPPTPPTPNITIRRRNLYANKRRPQVQQKQDADTATPIPRAVLVEWKRLDVAEEEAKARGGWGKLNLDEFQAIFHSEEARSNRLDYLGSWIDFCIP